MPVFVAGGVVPSIGQGSVAASLGRLISLARLWRLLPEKEVCPGVSPSLRPDSHQSRLGPQDTVDMATQQGDLHAAPC